ncbi:unnamed protein product [Clavelina lepadiformis]|uniref:Uncharacterized protein n=1 Tax=Clavelina lepadiformis TaxID=159417 RepID=A0ABP0G7H3_CLALP
MKETRFTTNPQKEKLHFDALRFGSWSFVHPTSTPLILNYVSTPTNWLSVEFSEKVSALTSRRREQVKPPSCNTGSIACNTSLSMYLTKKIPSYSEQ